MHARSTTVMADSGSLDAVVERVRGELLPIMQRQDGFKGFTLLVDRTNGTVIGTSYWASEDALRASEAEIAPSREETARAVGANQPTVQLFEVAIDVQP